MKPQGRGSARKKNGFTLVEVLMSMGIIAASGIMIFATQSSTWKISIGANRTLIAGHMIESQIESMRMAIEQNVAQNFPPQSSQISQNGVNLKWTISSANRPTDNATLTDVCKCDMVASWGKTTNDTLKITTYLSKMF